MGPIDDGVKWTALQDGRPSAPVTWVVVEKQAHDVVISTYGRGRADEGRD